MAAALVAGAITLAVASQSRTKYQGGQSSSTGQSHAAGAFDVTSTLPVASATNVSSDTVISVTFDQPVDVRGPTPSLAPPVAGSWRQTDPRTFSFESAAPLIPGTNETLTVPGGARGVRDLGGETLSQSMTVGFEVGSSTLRLQQLLAELGYLPVSFAPSGPTPGPREMAEPQAGTFTWRWSDSLSGFEPSWTAGDSGAITMGAVMTFEDQHQLTVDGIAGPHVWSALLGAASAGDQDPKPYDYVYVSKTLPENLTVYVNGQAQFIGIPVNTGIHGVDTPDGTYPVFEHVPSSEMKGTNLDGSTYDDPNVPWASYFHGGDALHGFVRGSYGYPQSNGCVEMSIANAGAIWPYTPIGTLVTVVGPAS